MSKPSPAGPEEIIRDLEEAVAGIASTEPVADRTLEEAPGDAAGARRDLRVRTRATLVAAMDEGRAQWASGFSAAVFFLEFLGSVRILIATSGLAAAAVNSAAKAVVFGIVCALVTANPRRYGQLLSLVVIGELVLAIGLVAALAAGSDFVPHDVASHAVGQIAGVAWVLVSVALAALLAWVQHVVARLRHELAYLSVLEFRTLSVIAEMACELGSREAEVVARDIDDYLASFDSTAKRRVRQSVVRVALEPLKHLRPPFPLLSPTDRTALAVAIEERGRANDSRSAHALVVARRLVYLAFYGTTGVREAREHPGPARTPRPPTHSRVARIGPAHVPGGLLSSDITIIGSGAAASILAYELASAGREVLMLERGRHIEPDEPGMDELYRRAALLADGGLQAILDPARPLVTASCVGGITSLGSGPLVAPSPTMLDRWEAVGAPPDRAELERAVDFVRDTPAVCTVPLDTWEPRLHVVEHGLKGITDGVEPISVAPCAQLASRPALEEILPRAQEEAEGRLAVLSQCTVRQLDLDDRKVRAVRCRTQDGRDIEVRANTVILAAGSPGSGVLLQRSGIDAAGQNMSFYMGGRVVGDFEEPFESGADGVPVSWGISAEPRFVLRLERTSPVADALRTPGGLHEHAMRMHRRGHHVALNALIGTTPGSAHVREGTLELTPQPEDLRRIRSALRVAAQALTNAGAKSIFVAADRGETLETADQIEDIPETALWTTVIYPLGGSALSADPVDGVVGSDFRVHGHHNLFACDASVLPVGADVDPQLTVMALAHLAARAILDYH